MKELRLTSRVLLFSTNLLIMRTYINRFLAYATVISNLSSKYLEKKEASLVCLINNLSCWIQTFRITIFTMFLIYIGHDIAGVSMFAIALILLILLVREIQISAQVLKTPFREYIGFFKKVRFLK